MPARKRRRSARIAPLLRLGAKYESTTSAGTGRFETHPNVNGSRCSARIRSADVIGSIDPGTLATMLSGRNSGGRKFS